MAAAYSSRHIVEDYLHYKLLNRGVAWRFPPPPHRPGGQRRRTEASSPPSWRSEDESLPGPWLAPPPLQVVLRSAGDELERRYHDDLSDQVSRLCGDGDGGGGAALRRSLTAIREELFVDGVNWGRIVAMMEVGGALSAELARTGEPGRVDDVAGWMEESLDGAELRGWIQDNGGWDAFVELYESRPARFWSLRTVFGLVALGAAGITLGALFTHK
ncbi:apoptosis regulator Bcl-2-like [Embiotoca jacksoni]|uniref:apoptosis regulator Bcl-2-like n=1 Tax=Embiotoca jacksoni TaxID=100190 RepID=UPI0037045E5B